MKRVLIIDDEPLVSDLLADGLAGDDREICIAANAKAAFDLLADRPFDLVITDILMPDVDGIELIRVIRNRYPDIRVMAMSGGGKRLGSRDDLLRFATLLGAYAAIAKPFDMREVRQLVARCLESQSTLATSG